MTERKIVTASAAKNAAKMFNYGNLASVIIPVLIPFWFGASMFIYAMNRHNPNPRVGYYTQWAAYRFYGLIGLVIPVGTFFPLDIRYYLATWAVLAAVIIPLEIHDLRKISREDWKDIEYEV